MTNYNCLTKGKKIGVYQGQASQWITCYEVNGEFFTEDRGHFGRADEQVMRDSIWNQILRDSQRKAWFNNKLQKA
jgi:hypothetical protein|tara:strand:+ start:282 stop:506 length:225 start_codon:yes stop_codon:yes gene_type:complete